MRLKTVTSTRPTVEIHPYVQGRLRALPCHEEAGGLLLGSMDNDVIHITGFRRVPPNAMRQAAADAGTALAGLYRVQTPDAPLLLPEEADLCRHTRSLFLLIDATNAQATAWRHPGAGPPILETLSLSGSRPAPTAVPRARDASHPIPWLLLALLLTAVSITAYKYWPVAVEPSIALDLQSRDGELVAIWQQSGAPSPPPESVSLSVREGDSEQTMDLTKSFTPHGNVVLHPRARNVVVTLQLRYSARPSLTRSATYIGFEPVIVAAKPEPNTALLAEISNLRKRNKELLDAVTALRKHFEQ